MKIWSVVLVRSGMSSDARAKLSGFFGELGAALYQPMEYVQVLRGRGPKRRQEIVEQPLFGNYALAHLPAASPPFSEILGPLGRSRGVLNFVRSSTGHPATVPDLVVEHLLSRDRRGEFERFRRTKSGIVGDVPDWLSPGSTVAVREDHAWLGGSLFVVEKVHSKSGQVDLRISDHAGSSIPIRVHVAWLRGY